MLYSLNLPFIKFLFTDLFGFCYFVLPVVAAFAGQLLLCSRAKHALPKLLPLGLGLLILAAVYATFLVLGENLLYLFPMGIAGLLLLGSAAGWLVYALARLAARLKKASCP